MGTREVGLAGGIAAAGALGAVRFADNCADSGARMASSGVDDALRVGGRAAPIGGGSLADDAARVGAPARRLDPPIELGGRSVAIDLQGEDAISALGQGSVESRVGKDLLEQGVEQALESGTEALLDDDDKPRVPTDPMAFDRTTKARRAKLLEDVEGLAAVLAAAKPPTPLAILAGSADGGATLVTHDGERAVDGILRDCLAHGVRCVVVACPPADDDCGDEARAAWAIAIDEAQGRTVDDVLAAFYLEIAIRGIRDVALRRADRNVAGIPVAVVTRVR